MDWGIWVPLGAALVAALIGAWAQRRFERRARLIAYQMNVGAFRSTGNDGSEIRIHSHTVVVRNIGALSAHHVRIGHQGSPQYSVSPNTAYEHKTLPNGGSEIVFPVLTPSEQVFVNYIYGPEWTAPQVNTHVKSDEVLAEWINVLITRQYSSRTLTAVWLLMFLGATTLLYLLFIGVRALVLL